MKSKSWTSRMHVGEPFADGPLVAERRQRAALHTICNATHARYTLSLCHSVCV